MKLAPLEAVNAFQQAVVLRADLPVSPHWGVEAGVGAVVNSLSLAYYAGEAYRGIKVQPALKYYFSPFAAGDNSYLALVYKYININNDRYMQVSRQGGQYAEWMLLRRHRTVQGIALRYGVQQYLGRRKRWIIEPFVGFGIRQLRVTDQALPPDAEFVVPEEAFNLDRPPGIYTTPDAMFGCYLGWTIGGNNATSN